MSKLIYDGFNHTIELIGTDGKSLGKWTAYNNINRAFAKKHYHGARHLKNGSYSTVDTTKPHAHAASANGPYGSYDIIRFNYPGHAGWAFIPAAQTLGTCRVRNTRLMAASARPTRR